ncbi:flagellar assembly protein T N-terminal domain-containing protein [Colwelliaceae bacterium 6471]
MRIWLLPIISILASFSSFGQWYETQGQAYIKNGDNHRAKTRAMEGALKKALLVAGASVSSAQQVVNGLLTQDEISIRASGTVNSLELVSENYVDDMVTVTIRADIFPQEKQCFSSDYRKTLLLTRSKLLHREQANIGGIYEVGAELMQNLSKRLNKEGQYLDTKLALKNKTQFSRLNQSLDAEGIKTLTMSLSSITDSQYVMYSEISDISFAQSVNNGWQFWQEDEFNRHFNLSLYIYNGGNGELVFAKDYQSSAPWTFTKRAQVDVNSDVFWSSEYGDAINQTLDEISTDIDENMMCQPTRGKIVRVEGDTVTINLGKRHGVQVGDEFSLLHSNNFISDNGKNYAGFNVSPYKVKVTQVSQESARAVTPDNHILGNIQLSDLAVRY